MYLKTELWADPEVCSLPDFASDYHALSLTYAKYFNFYLLNNTFFPFFKNLSFFTPTRGISLPLSFLLVFAFRV